MNQTSKPKEAIYRGRFAPSPTGELHLGSLLAAVASYCEAVRQNGEWILRIEDIDKAREVAGASDSIIRLLDDYGFQWHGEIQYQSKRIERFNELINQLKQRGLIYACHCSRKFLIKEYPEQHVYPRLCRDNANTEKPIRSWRLKVDDVDKTGIGDAKYVDFDDRIQGPQHFNLEADIGDFIIQRVSGEISYQLAVAVDDAELGISDVVRGTDLLDSTPRQLFIQQQLGLPSPSYAHLPLILNAEGQKLSKQTHAKPLKTTDSVTNIWQAIDFLGQKPPHELKIGGLEQLWQWAFENWEMRHVPKSLTNTTE